MKLKVRCTKQDLNLAVGAVVRAIPSRSPLPILSGVLLETTSGGLRVTATDLELAVRVQIPAEVQQEGRAVLPARLLGEITSHLPPSTVEIEADAGTAKITCERSSFELAGLPAEDFPRTPEEVADPDLEHVCTLPWHLLRAMIRQTLFAASRDDIRPALSGVHVAGEGDTLRFAATDGSRLAVRTARVTLSRPVSATVPGKAMQELARLCGAVWSDVEVGIADRVMVFSFLTEGIRVSTRTISEPFPDYQRVIPAEFKQQVHVGTGRLQAALRRVALAARDEATVVRLVARDGTLHLSSRTPEVGQAWEEMEVSASGEPVEVALNARFLLDALEEVETNDVVLGLTGPLTPAVLKPAGGEEHEYVYVVAPVRVQD